MTNIDTSGTLQTHCIQIAQLQLLTLHCM